MPPPHAEPAFSLTVRQASSTSWVPTQVPLPRWRKSCGGSRVKQMAEGRLQPSGSGKWRQTGRVGGAWWWDRDHTDKKKTEVLHWENVSPLSGNQKKKKLSFQEQEGKWSTQRLQGDSNELIEIPDKLKKKKKKRETVKFCLCASQEAFHSLLETSFTFNNRLVATSKMSYAINRTPFG